MSDNCCYCIYVDGPCYEDIGCFVGPDQANKEPVSCSECFFHGDPRYGEPPLPYYWEINVDASRHCVVAHAEPKKEPHCCQYYRHKDNPHWQFLRLPIIEFRDCNDPDPEDTGEEFPICGFCVHFRCAKFSTQEGFCEKTGRSTYGHTKIECQIFEEKDTWE